MVKLSEFQADFDGKIFINDPIEWKVLNKVPIAVFEIKLNVGAEYGKKLDQPGQPYYNVGYSIDETNLALLFQNIPVSHSYISQGSVDPHMVANASYILRISIEDLKEIESKRVDDITLNLVLEGKIIPHRSDSFQPISTSKRFMLHIPWKFSEREWAKFLRDLSYSERWIVEMERPKLEGYHEVVEFIEKAGKGIMENAPADQVVSDLRSAWDRMDPYLSKYLKMIKEKINENSESEVNQPTKDERVNSIQESLDSFINDILELKRRVDKLTQMGPHKDVYSIKREDALLAYRLTVSLMSYYSELLKRITERSGSH